MSDEFPAFAVYEEHEALREAVRALADDKIVPRAAEIDRTSEFPWDVYEALVKADLQGALDYALGYVKERKQCGFSGWLCGDRAAG